MPDMGLPAQCSCLLSWISTSLLALQFTNERVWDRTNCAEMQSQWFYRWIGETYTWHVVGQLVAIYLLWGFDGLVSQTSEQTVDG